MGTYLTKPVLEKDVEEGVDLDSTSTPVSWAVVDMQGWRKTMEDSHLAETNVPTVEGDSNPDNVAQVFGVFDGHGGAEVARFCSLYLIDVLKQQPEWKNGSDMGQAFAKSFHAIDRMIGDERRRNEISDLRLNRPSQHDSRTIAETFPIPLENQIVQPAKESISTTDSNQSNDEDLPGVDGEGETANDHLEISKLEKIVQDDNEQIEDKSLEIKPSSTIDAAAVEEEKKENRRNDDDSVRGILPDELSDDESLNDSDDAEENAQFLTANTDVAQLFKRFLSLQTGDKGQGQMILQSNDENSDESKSDDQSQKDTKIEVKKPIEITTPCASIPTRIVNGRTVCNLPDHSIHAGCTSVCAVIVNKVLTVANAGDSRAVLCRAGGVTKPMSFDHKPLQETELKRIKNAGGFVNQFGRVNGNLNLSRAIGDLKYKQVPGIPPSEQMITADPDIQQVTLKDDDEFIILACDGIWDCLSNEEAVRYVESRINTKSPKEIGIEMLDEIVSVDPRNTQGIGGDNMTVMIIDLQPSKRQYTNNLLLATKEKLTIATNSTENTDAEKTE